MADQRRVLARDLKRQIYTLVRCPICCESGRKTYQGSMWTGSPESWAFVSCPGAQLQCYGPGRGEVYPAAESGQMRLDWAFNVCSSHFITQSISYIVQRVSNGTTGAPKPPWLLPCDLLTASQRSCQSTMRPSTLA